MSAPELTPAQAAALEAAITAIAELVSKYGAPLVRRAIEEIERTQMDSSEAEADAKASEKFGP